LRGGLAWIYTRSDLNWTKRFPTTAHAMGHVPAPELILDGEDIQTIAHKDDGLSIFEVLYDRGISVGLATLRHFSTIKETWVRRASFVNRQEYGRRFGVMFTS
jgi:hypothetical protein